MVDACVYAWAFSLLGLQVFGDTSKPTGMPTLLLRALCQGDSIAKTTKYGRILLFHIIRVGCRRYRRRVARHPQLKASIPTSSKQKNLASEVQSHGNNYPIFKQRTASVEQLSNIV